MPPQMLDTDANGVNTAADDFLEVYENWFDERTEVAEGVGVYNKSRGFRSETIERLKMYGYTVTDTEAKDKTDEVRVEEENMEERIYLCLDSRRAQPRRSQSKQRDCYLVSQYNPRDNRTACTDSKHSYHCRMLCVIAATVDGAPTLSEMMKRLDERTDNYNILKSAKAFIEQLTLQAKAVFFATLRCPQTTSYFQDYNRRERECRCAVHYTQCKCCTEVLANRMEEEQQSCSEV